MKNKAIEKAARDRVELAAAYCVPVYCDIEKIKSNIQAFLATEAAAT